MLVGRGSTTSLHRGRFGPTATIVGRLGECHRSLLCLAVIVIVVVLVVLHGHG